MVDVMSPLLKFLLPLVVVLPLGGFVAGSLVGAANDEPPARNPIVLREGDESTSPGQPTTGPTDRPTRRSEEEDDDDRDDDDEVTVITPSPYEYDDDDGRERGDDSGDDDGGDDDDDGEGDGDDD
jgi:major membrane immunogen (membrane-anchored lipoprotein)